ncbi:hypothetical protein [Halovivax asiaticus]|uniref:hypothetical protein n=1 Tax=Halovivax asiaticus TaxID=332953 RepID=UPI0012674C4F|nr:hypothetical protein [Halovivax asiaticus]
MNPLKFITNRENGEERRPPVHIPDQRELLSNALDEPTWVILLDAGRFDMFDQLVGQYFNGKLRRVWNGGVGYTGDWFARNANGSYPDRGLFSWLPLRDQQGEYDGRDHFEIAPEIDREMGVGSRLAALGYTDGDIDEGFSEAPGRVNRTVRDRCEQLQGGIIRYIKPHPPFDGLEDLTSESTKTKKTEQALDSDRLTYAELVQAYRETYRTGFEYAKEIVGDLEGNIILTADHGTCLTCDQLYHGRHHDKHDHLTIVPWFEVSGLA